MYLMTQSLESYNLDKINGPSKVISHASMYSKTILPTQDTGVPTGVTMVLILILIATLLRSTAVQSRNCTVKKMWCIGTPQGSNIYVSMVTHTVTTETGNYCSPGAFSYTTFFTE